MPEPSNPASPRGNYISEWFGFRTYPTIRIDATALDYQRREICPFLTRNIGSERECVKSQNSRGVCTINTQQAHGRVDWLVCPYRALDDSLLRSAISKLFTCDDNLYFPGPALALDETRQKITAALASGIRCFFYFNEKLGGELSISSTRQSPQFSFDLTIIEIKSKDGEPTVGQFGVLEIQTMDFHGSYKHAVKDLQDGLRLTQGRFPDELANYPNWLSNRIEGPNISNVFKRTFYQLAFKFDLGQTDESTGCVLAIPESVWESWQPHLAAPELIHMRDIDFALVAPGDAVPERFPAWIFVFKIDDASTHDPAPLRLEKRIGTNVRALTHYALELAPKNALAQMRSERGLSWFVRDRLRSLWPELGSTIEPSNA